MKRKQNHRRVSRAKRPAVVVVQPQDGYTVTMRELALRDKMFGVGGSASWSDFTDQIRYIREQSTLVTFGR